MTPDARPSLPNFLICGAAKAGTTSLYHFLRKSPEVFMPDVKEPHFLVRDQVRGRISTLIDSPEEYARLFRDCGGRSLRGEASVFYLYYFEAAIRNIQDLLGDEIKIVILLRNPVDRAYSAYLQASKYNRKEKLSFIDALQAEEDRMRDPACSPMLFYKAAGMYSRMVGSYLEAFPNTGIFIFDDLQQDPQEFTGNLYAFLGLPSDGGNSFNEHQNIGGREWSSAFMGNALKTLGGDSVRRLARQLAPGFYETFKASLVARLMRPVSRMDATTREYLAGYFRADVARLSGIIGRDLMRWVD